MFTDRACGFIYDARTSGPACFTAAFVVWGVSLGKGKFLTLSKQYTKALMTLNTYHLNMTFRPFIGFNNMWLHLRGVTILGIDSSKCWIFTRVEEVWGHSDRDHWTPKSNQFISLSAWLLQPNLKLEIWLHSHSCRVWDKK